MPPRRRAKPRSPLHAALGKRLEEMRREAGLTQEQLADRAGTDFSRIGELERGATDPRLTTLHRVADGLGMSLAEILTGIEGKPARRK